MALVVKNLPANAEDVRDVGLIPGSGRSPGGGHDSPLQCSCLENPMDRGAWQATVCSLTESDTTEVTWHVHAHARSVYISVLFSPVYLFPLPLWWLWFVFCIHDYYCFVNKFICAVFLDFIYKWYHMILVFLWHTSLTMTIFRSIHLATDGIISLFCMAE